jgi:hypothetical protein
MINRSVYGLDRQTWHWFNVFHEQGINHNSIADVREGAVNSGLRNIQGEIRRHGTDLIINNNKDDVSSFQLV